MHHNRRASLRVPVLIQIATGCACFALWSARSFTLLLFRDFKGLVVGRRCFRPSCTRRHQREISRTPGWRSILHQSNQAHFPAGWPGAMDFNRRELEDQRRQFLNEAARWHGDRTGVNFSLL
jgi:hypothetical protein